tara:strand:+ start:3008 stop:5899 length:2892 start_codon:yes stop_codon:yes gene_type:complete
MQKTEVPHSHNRDSGARWMKRLRTMGYTALCSGVILAAASNPAAAVAQTTLQPRQAEQSYEKARIKFHSGETAAAAIHLKNALQAYPGHLPSRILMAEILISNGDGAGAEIELNYAQERGADEDRLVVLFGHAYILQGKNDYLLDVIRNGNRDNSVEADISYLRGRAYFANKKLANAKQNFEAALARNPYLYQAQLGLAQVAAVHKNFAEAMQYVDAALALDASHANSWILKAKIYKLRGFRDEAMSAINEAMALDNKNVLIRLTRAALLIDAKNFDDAEKDVDFILDLIPREPRAKYLKAIINAAQGDYATSSSTMTEVINILRAVPPEVMEANPTYYYLSGLTNFQFGNIDEARDNLHKYLKIERNDIGAKRLLGALELKAGKPLAANAVLADANRDQPNNPTILTLLGMAYLQIGNVERANIYLERVTKLLPDSSESLTNLARGKMAAGSFDDAINNLLKAEEHNFSSRDVKLLLIKAYQQSGNTAKAVEIAEKLLEKEPDNTYFLNLYGTAMGLAGNHKKARETYERVQSLNKDDLTSLLHLARMDVVEGQTDQAIANLKTKLEDLPDSPVLMLELGNIYKGLQDSKNALFWYKKAHSVNSKDFLVLQHLVQGYLMNQDVKSSLAATTEYIDNNPESAEAYQLQGKLYQQAGKPADAIESLKRAVDYDTNRGEALLTLAKAQLRINDRASATKNLQKAIVWDENLIDAYIALIRMAIEDKNKASGFAMIAQVRKLSEKASPAADILSGDLHLALKNYTQAREAYHAALRIGDNPVAIMGLYKAHAGLGDDKEAIRVLEDWYQKYPEDIRSALSLGAAYRRAGQIETAVVFHEKLVQDNPDMPVVLNNAANIHFLAGTKDKALEYARKAHELMPDNANIMDTLAWIETRLDNPEAALPLLRKAMVLHFSDPEIKYHLAITLDKLNRRSEARKLLTEALASRKNFADKDEAQAILANWRKK